jgi:glycosyltransferase involved in cell wall biosynthesis
MASGKRVIAVLGPGPVFKGGMANYTVSLCLALAALPDVEVHLISWTNQYPSIVPRDFKDRTGAANPLTAAGVTEHYLLDYNSPSTWAKTAETVKRLGAEKLIIQWSIALQGGPLSFVAGRLKGSGVEVLFDLHFVQQKEASVIDGFFSKLAFKKAGGFIVHSQKTADELKSLLPNLHLEVLEQNTATLSDGKTKVIRLFHPVYDLFKRKDDFDIEAFKNKNGLKKHVFLFFGFIRKYKGLHFCIEAFSKLAAERDDVSLLIVGESFWKTLDQTKLSTKVKNALFGIAKSILRPGAEDESAYNPLTLIDTLGLQDKVMVVNSFVSNADVYQYFQASEALLLFYEYATPSGVESMAYNFKIPILATAVGHFPETIKDGINGYLAADGNTTDMARVMARQLSEPILPENVDAQARTWTWDAYARAILANKAL